MDPKALSLRKPKQETGYSELHILANPLFPFFKDVRFESMAGSIVLLSTSSLLYILLPQTRQSACPS